MQAAIAAPRGFDAYLDELEGHYRAAIADVRARPAVPIEGSRSLAVLAFADELAAEPELLAAWSRSIDAGDDVTLVIDGSGSSEQELLELLGPAIAAADLERDDAADLLAVAGGDRLHARAQRRRGPQPPAAHGRARTPAALRRIGPRGAADAARHRAGGNPPRRLSAAA